MMVFVTKWVETVEFLDEAEDVAMKQASMRGRMM